MFPRRPVKFIGAQLGKSWLRVHTNAGLVQLATEMAIIRQHDGTETARILWVARSQHSSHRFGLKSGVADAPARSLKQCYTSYVARLVSATVVVLVADDERCGVERHFTAVLLASSGGECVWASL